MPLTAKQKQATYSPSRRFRHKDTSSLWNPAGAKLTGLTPMLAVNFDLAVYRARPSKLPGATFRTLQTRHECHIQSCSWNIQNIIVFIIFAAPPPGWRKPSNGHIFQPLFELLQISRSYSRWSFGSTTIVGDIICEPLPPLGNHHTYYGIIVFIIFAAASSCWRKPSKGPHIPTNHGAFPDTGGIPSLELWFNGSCENIAKPL